MEQYVMKRGSQDAPDLVDWQSYKSENNDLLHTLPSSSAFTALKDDTPSSNNASVVSNQSHHVAFEGKTTPYLLQFHDHNLEQDFGIKYQQVQETRLRIVLVVVLLCCPSSFLITVLFPNDFPPFTYANPITMTLFSLVILCFMTTRTYRTHAKWMWIVLCCATGFCIVAEWNVVRIFRQDLEVDIVTISVLTTSLIPLRQKFRVAVMIALVEPCLHLVANTYYLPLEHAFILASPIITFSVLCLTATHRIEWLARRTFFLQYHLDQLRCEMAKAKSKSDRVLENILPAATIDAYRNNVSVNRRYESCTVIFIKLLSVPSVAASSAKQTTEVLKHMNRVISRIERCCDRHGIEKVKTVGTLFMAVCGAPNESPEHMPRAVNFAFSVLDVAERLKHEVQIGMQSGSVIGGIIGTKIMWDIWGDCVNSASRMCNLSRPGHIQCTQAMQQALHSSKRLTFVPREDLVAVKGKGLMQTYFVHRSNRLEATLEQNDEHLPGLIPTAPALASPSAPVDPDETPLSTAPPYTSYKTLAPNPFPKAVSFSVSLRMPSAIAPHRMKHTAHAEVATLNHSNDCIGTGERLVVDSTIVESDQDCRLPPVAQDFESVSPDAGLLKPTSRSSITSITSTDMESLGPGGRGPLYLTCRHSPGKPPPACTPVCEEVPTIWMKISTIASRCNGALFMFHVKLVDELERMISESDSGGSPIQEREVGQIAQEPNRSWGWLIKRLWGLVRKTKVNLTFTDGALEGEFWNYAQEGSLGRTRVALGVLLAHSVVLAILVLYSPGESSLESLIFSHFPRLVAISLMTALSYLMPFDWIRRRVAINLFLGLLVVLQCCRLLVENQLSIVSPLHRTLAVGDSFFLINWIGLYPLALGRFNDLAMLSMVLVFSLVGMRTTSGGMLPSMILAAGYTLLAGYLTESEARWQFLLERRMRSEMAVLKEEEERNIQLLRCCMPASVLRILVDDSVTDMMQASMRAYTEVIVFVTDVVGFTAWSSSVAPEMVVEMLHSLVSMIDGLVDLHGAEKIKTIGDGYVAVIGLEGLGEKELENVKDLALSLQHMSMSFCAPDGTQLHMRIGIGIGHATACIVGKRKWFWDLWGEAVVNAETLEQEGLPNKIHIAAEALQKLETYPFARELVYMSREQFLSESSGEVVKKISSVMNGDTGAPEHKPQSYFILGMVETET
eukprot:CAMPEP_0184645220 /NCGR_PEP_ID=MMETSP0308-20130426/1729_1 /TAXON_ID=38269 /ORGANISM="Gloeochaete witrockiana, Strain SAG 46.84" /LENGTH=1183 /DNA_ID=CAMNT_0027074083 /DNA_START=203 /DNA_END=3754 /DNA_ORIENTATION=-